MTYTTHQTSEHQVDSNLSDERLVELTLEGKRRAFDILACRHQAAFTRAAWKLVKNDSDAQDVVQTAYCNMFRKLHTFKPGSNFKSWAFRVVTNTGLMRLRKHKHRMEVELTDVGTMHGLDQQPPSISIAPKWTVRADVLLEQKELFAHIDAALGELPQKYRKVFVMREFEECTLKEISDALDLSIPAVKSRLHRARLFLRATLKPYTDGRM